MCPNIRHVLFEPLLVSFRTSVGIFTSLVDAGGRVSVLRFWTRYSTLLQVNQQVAV